MKQSFPPATQPQSGHIQKSPQSINTDQNLQQNSIPTLQKVQNKQQSLLLHNSTEKSELCCLCKATHQFTKELKTSETISNFKQHLLTAQYFCYVCLTSVCNLLSTEQFVLNEQKEVEKLLNIMMNSPSEEVQKEASKIQKICYKSQRKFSDLLEDLSRGGTTFQKISLVEIEANNRRVISNQAIFKDEILMFVPKQKLITLEMTRDLPLAQKINHEKSMLRSPKHTLLSIFLLYEIEKQDKSNYYYYIKHFPQNFDQFPINYSQHLLSELAGTSILEQIEQKKLDLKKDFEHLVSLDAEFQAKFSFKKFTEMRMIVSSRVFGIVVDKLKTDALVPYADMLNHKLPKQTCWYFCDRDQGFVIKSLRDIEGGTEIYDSYGQKCNSRFLLNYGFTLPQNICNEVNIKIPMKLCGQMQLSLHLEHKQLSIRVSKMLEQRSFHEMISALRFTLSLSSQGSFENQKQSIELTLENIKQTGFRSVQMEIGVWETLIKLVENQLLEYPHTYKEDKTILNELMKDPQQNSNLINIVTLRRGEKQVLIFYQTMGKKMLKYLNKKATKSQLKNYQPYLTTFHFE